jgi:diguanylate cyclase (GGDEF)-like protein
MRRIAVLIIYLLPLFSHKIIYIVTVLIFTGFVFVPFLRNKHSFLERFVKNETLCNIRADVVSHMQTGYVFLDNQHSVIDINSFVASLVKVDTSSIVGKHISTLNFPLFTFIYSLLSKDAPIQQSTFMHKDHYLNSYFLVELCDVFDQKKYKSGTSILITNISELHYSLNQLEYIGSHDDLTGAYNRYYFQQQLQALEKSETFPIAIVVGDVNGLKHLNDTLGHSVGDSLLVEAAELLLKVFPKGSSVCRIGGDEFVILLSQVDEDLIKSHIHYLENYQFKNHCNDDSVGLSLDYAVRRNSQKTLEQTFNEADANMYLKKLMYGSSRRDNNIQLLQKILSGKSIETTAHLNRTAHLAKNFALTLNLNNSETNDLILLSQLHDIGKTVIPDDILFKPSSLNQDEWKIMKSHCQLGVDIVECSPSLKSVSTYILHHHEHYDGMGYPESLFGDNIPYLSRIISIIDSYDAMTSKRVYKAAMSKEAAIEELERCKGTQFDPYLCDKFIEMIVLPSFNL